MYLIYWRSNQTGYTGHGSKPMTKETAEAWIKIADEEFGDVITHWLVKVDRKVALWTRD